MEIQAGQIWEKPQAFRPTREGGKEGWAIMDGLVDPEHMGWHRLTVIQYDDETLLGSIVRIARRYVEPNDQRPDYVGQHRTQMRKSLAKYIRLHGLKLRETAPADLDGFKRHVASLVASAREDESGPARRSLACFMILACDAPGQAEAKLFVTGAYRKVMSC